MAVYIIPAAANMKDDGGVGKEREANVIKSKNVCMCVCGSCKDYSEERGQDYISHVIFFTPGFTFFHKRRRE